MKKVKAWWGVGREMDEEYEKLTGKKLQND